LDTVALLLSRQNESGDFDALPVTPRASGDDWDMKHRAALLLHQPQMRFDFALGLQPVIEFVARLVSTTFKDLVGTASDEFRHTLRR